MALYIASLNSGSNGNCYYIGTDRAAVLVDAGLSCRETEKRMRRLGLSLSAVKGIFISHEHDDHIRGVEVLSSRYALPIFITETCLQHSRLSLQPQLVRSLRLNEAVSAGELTVTAFPKLHDASDPCSFIIVCNGIRIGVFTDIGMVCKQVAHHFATCHAVFLESNYDEKMLQEGRYPYPLKQRIRGGQGHLSNSQALELFVGKAPSFMSHILLSHLSQDNNRPELVQALFEREARGTQIVIASRHQETEVYRIEEGFCREPAVPMQAPNVTPAEGDLHLHSAGVTVASLKKRRALAKTANAAGVVQGSLF